MYELAKVAIIHKKALPNLCIEYAWKHFIVLGGEILSKFESEKYDFNLNKRLSMEKKKMAQIHQIFEKQVSKSPVFYDKFQ
jgi:hypothetical protein